MRAEAEPADSPPAAGGSAPKGQMTGSPARLRKQVWLEQAILAYRQSLPRTRSGVQAILEREMGWAGNRVGLSSSNRLSSRPASSWWIGEVVQETYEFVHREAPLPSTSGEGELLRPEELIRLGFPPGEYALRVVAAGPGFSVEKKGLGRVQLP